MNQVIVKIKDRNSRCKYKKLLSTDSKIYEPIDNLDTAIEYNPNTLLEDDEWYQIKEFNTKKFSIDILENKIDTVDYDLLDKNDFNKIGFVITIEGEQCFFQNISKTKLMKKKMVIHMGDNFKFKDDCTAISINPVPDAIFDFAKNVLYFKKLSSITTIFTGIDQLYRTATEEETQQFLQNDFITTVNGFDSNSVKSSNRRRIALATDTLKNLSKEDKESIFSYIQSYCQDLKVTDGSFEINNEEELKQLLFGIEQRYYTTTVGAERRLANSVIKID